MSGEVMVYSMRQVLDNIRNFHGINGYQYSEGVATVSFVSHQACYNAQRSITARNNDVLNRLVSFGDDDQRMYVSLAGLPELGEDNILHNLQTLSDETREAAIESEKGSLQGLTRHRILEAIKGIPGFVEGSIEMASVHDVKFSIEGPINYFSFSLAFLGSNILSENDRVNIPPMLGNLTDNTHLTQTINLRQVAGNELEFENLIKGLGGSNRSKQ